MIRSLPGDATLAALRHGFFWMLLANGTGLLLALLLLVPDANALLGPWTYGRWVPVHLNLQLFGWTSLPLVAWLFRVYRVDQARLSAWGAAAVWAWSAALVGGASGWLQGHTSGKIFLDWTGPGLALFVAAMAGLWLVLGLAWLRGGRDWGRLAGLLALGAVPALMLLATRQDVYPPVNPDSGGPTGASLLGSTLTVVFLLLLLPRSLARQPRPRSGRARIYWIIFGVQSLAVPVLEHSRASHRDPAQWFGLGMLLLWIILLPAYYNRYSWQPLERKWLRIFLAWLALLILSGWTTFLPGVLDASKFTDTLVAHAHLAMAGFTTTFLLFLTVVLTGGTPVLARGAAWWNLATGGYVAVMGVAGILEGLDPDWILRADPLRTVLYCLRLACGVVLLAVAAWWWLGLNRWTPAAQERRAE